MHKFLLSSITLCFLINNCSEVWGRKHLESYWEKDVKFGKQYGEVFEENGMLKYQLYDGSPAHNWNTKGNDNLFKSYQNMKEITKLAIKMHEKKVSSEKVFFTPESDKYKTISDAANRRENKNAILNGIMFLARSLHYLENKGNDLGFHVSDYKEFMEAAGVIDKNEIENIKSDSEFYWNDPWGGEQYVKQQYDKYKEEKNEELERRLERLEKENKEKEAQIAREKEEKEKANRIAEEARRNAEEKIKIVVEENKSLIQKCTELIGDKQIQGIEAGKKKLFSLIKKDIKKGTDLKEYVFEWEPKEEMYICNKDDNEEIDGKIKEVVNFKEAEKEEENTNNSVKLFKTISEIEKEKVRQTITPKQMEFIRTCMIDVYKKITKSSSGMFGPVKADVKKKQNKQKASFSIIWIQLCKILYKCIEDVVLIDPKFEWTINDNREDYETLFCEISKEFKVVKEYIDTNKENEDFKERVAWEKGKHSATGSYDNIGSLCSKTINDIEGYINKNNPVVQANSILKSLAKLIKNEEYTNIDKITLSEDAFKGYKTIDSKNTEPMVIKYEHFVSETIKLLFQLLESKYKTNIEKTIITKEAFVNCLTSLLCDNSINPVLKLLEADGETKEKICLLISERLSVFVCEKCFEIIAKLIGSGQIATCDDCIELVNDVAKAVSNLTTTSDLNKYWLYKGGMQVEMFKYIKYIYGLLSEKILKRSDETNCGSYMAIGKETFKKIIDTIINPYICTINMKNKTINEYEAYLDNECIRLRNLFNEEYENELESWLEKVEAIVEGLTNSTQTYYRIKAITSMIQNVFDEYKNNEGKNNLLRDLRNKEKDYYTKETLAKELESYRGVVRTKEEHSFEGIGTGKKDKLEGGSSETKKMVDSKAKKVGSKEKTTFAFPSINKELFKKFSDLKDKRKGEEETESKIDLKGGLEKCKKIMRKVIDEEDITDQDRITLWNTTNMNWKKMWEILKVSDVEDEELNYLYGYFCLIDILKSEINSKSKKALLDGWGANGEISRRGIQSMKKQIMAMLPIKKEGITSDEDILEFLTEEGITSGIETLKSLLKEKEKLGK